MSDHLLPYLANCSLLFTEEPLLRRPAAARAAGFGAVEFWWPFAVPVPSDREVDAFTTAIERNPVSPAPHAWLAKWHVLRFDRGVRQLCIHAGT